MEIDSFLGMLGGWVFHWKNPGMDQHFAAIHFFENSSLLSPFCFQRIWSRRLCCIESVKCCRFVGGAPWLPFPPPPFLFSAFFRLLFSSPLGVGPGFPSFFSSCVRSSGRCRRGTAQLSMHPSLSLSIFLSLSLSFSLFLSARARLLFCFSLSHSHSLYLSLFFS